jgi:phage terminase large subunit-like protein
MPWQEFVSRTAMEVDPATGLLVYRTVVITVPRQSGKTRQELAVATHRCAAWPGQTVTYTAQTRVKAKQKWLDDHLETLKASPYGKRGMFRSRLSTGMEAVLWDNGSKYGIEATTEKAGHGDTLDLGFIDEAFAQVDARTEQAMKPAMLTRPQPQLWIVSTAGTPASQYLRGKVDAGRARCRAGRPSSVAYFEWGAPKDADPADPATWWACMPALGWTVTEEAVRAAYDEFAGEGKLAEFRRAYLNQWLDEVPDEWLIIPRQAWEALKAPPVAHGQVALAADVTPDRKAGSVVASWRRPDGHMDVELVEHRAGTSWLPGRLAEIVRRHRPCATVIDGAAGTPAGSLVDEIEALGVEVTRPNVRQLTEGCGRFFDAVMDSQSLRHNGDPALDAAVAGAIKRDLGDGWAWSRKATETDISPLVAATLAVWAHDKFAARKAPYDLLRSVG